MKKLVCKNGVWIIYQWYWKSCYQLSYLQLTNKVTTNDHTLVLLHLEGLSLMAIWFDSYYLSPI
jgi:hypothetical protein